MADIATIAAALGSIKTASDIAKLIKDSGSTLEKAEIKLQIAELISALADAKIEMAGVQSEILEKDKTISALQDLLDARKNLVWEAPYYWVEEGDKKDGPFCQKCYDVDHKLVRLQGGGREAWACRSCKNYFFDKHYRA